jgi:hypothetical protein
MKGHDDDPFCDRECNECEYKEYCSKHQPNPLNQGARIRTMRARYRENAHDTHWNSDNCIAIKTREAS